jgi:CRISPR system Cascade subunit CasC
MKIDLHFLQNFAPSNLNRDDTGAPKDCEFGGHRRARISSQCFKRAIRQAFVEHELLGPDTVDQLAARTKRLVHETAMLLVAAGRDEARALQLVAFALQSGKLKVVEENKTQYLLFLPRRAVGKLAEIVKQHWDALDAAAPKTPVAKEPAETTAAKPEKAAKDKPAAKQSKPDSKNAAKLAVPADVVRAVEAVLQEASKTPDLALFGRMIADNPDWNVEAACQVAQAISTNRVTMEFDFYTAVDDLKLKDTAGSDMMGTVAFQSACFYRYACLDVSALAENLGAVDKAEGRQLVRATLEAFLRASALAVPTGKQNSMAAQNLPSYLLAKVQAKGAPQSLANAFVKPVRPRNETSLVEASAEALERHLDAALGLWGKQDATLLACDDLDLAARSSNVTKLASFDAWVTAVVEAAMRGAA